jgi:zinc protease
VNLPDRKRAPAAEQITGFTLREGQKTLINDVPVYFVHDAQNDVLKLDFYYPCGVKHQPANGIATAAIQLMPEGTQKHSSEEIAILLDNQGAYLNTQSNRDEGSITLYCLPKFLPECTGILRELLEEANYPDNEIDIYKENTIQQLLVNEQKTSYLARKAFNASIFGSQNYYGSAVNQQDIQNISRETVMGFYRRVLNKKPSYVVVAGNITDSVMLGIGKIIDGLTDADHVASAIISAHTFVPDRVWVEKSDAVQCSVRMGKPLFNRKHPDYRELTIVNMILGGYFGSRLMKNIREEKGLTYGIYSSVDSYIDAGCFYIGAEVNASLVNQVIDETRAELMALIKSPISTSELQTVRNYYLGSFVRGFDGVFSLANYYKTLIDYELTYEYYYGYLNVINTISPERIMELTQLYLHPDSMCTIIAGKKHT